MRLFVYMARHPDLDPDPLDDTYCWFTDIAAMDEFISYHRAPLRFFVVGATSSISEEEASKTSSAVDWLMCDSAGEKLTSGTLDEFQAWLESGPLEEEPIVDHPAMGDPMEISVGTVRVSQVGMGGSLSLMIIRPNSLDPEKVQGMDRIYIPTMAITNLVHVASGLNPGDVVVSQKTRETLMVKDPYTLIGQDGTCYEWKDWPRPIALLQRKR